MPNCTASFTFEVSSDHGICSSCNMGTIDLPHRQQKGGLGG